MVHIILGNPQIPAKIQVAVQTVSRQSLETQKNRFSTIRDTFLGDLYTKD